MKGTREVKEVTKNVAFDLIDRELAELFSPEVKNEPVKAPIIEDKQLNPKRYLNRQLRSSRDSKEVNKHKRF